MIANNASQLNANNASQVVADSQGDVVAEFPGQGVWLCDAGYQWQQLTANNAASLDASSDFSYDRFHNVYTVIGVVAEFPGQGLWQYTSITGAISQPGTWTELTANNASTESVNGGGAVVAEFPGQGVWLTSNGGWQELTAADASSLSITGRIGTTSFLAAEFPGHGVWSWNSVSGSARALARPATRPQWASAPPVWWPRSPATASGTTPTAGSS